MVKIIDGEIVPDDDPRARMRAAPARRPAGGGPAPAGSGSSGGGAAAQPVGRPIFDWSAPPVRLMPDSDGAGVGGLPSVAVFGARVLPQHVLMVAGAALVFGWRAAVLAGLLLYWMHSVASGSGGARAGQQAAAGGNQAQRMAAAQDYFTRMMGQPPLGRGSSSGQAGGMGGVAAPAPGAAASGDPWAARGKPRRLNDSQ